MDPCRRKEGGREGGREGGQRDSEPVWPDTFDLRMQHVISRHKVAANMSTLCLTLIVYHGIEQTEGEEALGIISADAEGIHEGIQEHLAGDHQPMVGGPCGRCLQVRLR